MNTGIPLAVVGADFRVCSSRYRGRLVLSEMEARALGAALRSDGCADGFADLNTCNRNEWIVSGPDPGWAAELLRTKMIERARDDSEAQVTPYVYVGEAAARHIFRVAIGQESLVQGERQIAGQLWGTLERARTRGTASRILNGLGTVAGRLVRIALRRGTIGSASVGVHGLTLAHLRKRLGPRKARVAVVGLGQIGRRILSALEADPLFLPVALNRTCKPLGPVRPLEELPLALAEVDAAVVCTGAPYPTVRIADLSARRPHESLTLVDIGIPEQVERGSLPAHVHRIGIDELADDYQKTCAEPLSDADTAPLIENALAELRVFCNETTFAALLDTVQRHHTQLMREEIPRLVSERFNGLGEEARASLAQDLRSIVLDYTGEVFRTIRDIGRATPQGSVRRNPGCARAFEGVDCPSGLTPSSDQAKASEDENPCRTEP